MAPRRPGYGAVVASSSSSSSGGNSTTSSSPLLSRIPQPSPYQADSFSERQDERTTIPPSASPPSSDSTQGAGRRSWWRAGIVVVGAASALSAVVSVAHFASYATPTTINQTLSDSNSALLVDQTQQQQKQPTGKQPAQHETSGEATSDVGGDGPRSTKTTAASPEEEGLAFIAMNEYNRRGDVIGLGYPWLEGEILVEPHRITSLEVLSPQAGMTYTWKISEARNLDDAEVVDDSADASSAPGAAVPDEYVGEIVEVVFKRSPRYSIFLVETRDEDAMVMRSTSLDVFCRYVRREIRSLFADEREEMFDSMKILWDVTTDTGKELYGANYLDVWSIDMFHQVGASDINCDHLHDGIGFGITHSMVTMMFENSLQLVNPKLSLPYWDFTIEGAKVDTDFDGDYSRLRDASDLWTPEWFGGVDPVDFQVKDGRWANMEVPIVPQEHRDLLGADVYGRMRSPWNVNDRPYLTRGLGEMCGQSSTDFYAWPGCSTHYDLQDDYTSYYGYTWWSQYGPHGPVHVWVGGNVDCKRDMDKVMEIVGEEYRLSLSGYLFVMRKNLFRDHLFKCEGWAEADVTEEEIMTSGQCGCLDLNLYEGDAYIKVYEMFSATYDFPDFTDEEKRLLAIQFCNGEVGMGESSQSSSPLDPTFWSMHPTMERLLIFKLMAGTFTDVSWPDEPGTWVGMDGVEYDVVISTEQDECYGHRGSDVFPYGILENLITPEFTFFGRTGPNTISNRDMVRFFDPSMNVLTFIYDNFEWPHCTAMGYDFTDFYDPSTATSGPKGSAAPPKEKSKSGRVHGFGLFEKDEPHRVPMYAPPASVKNA